MMRGHQLFNSLFTTEQAPSLAAPERKGRSEEHIELRNALLFYRFYFYSKICNKNYPWVLAKLSEELFISVRTIQDVIGANHELLKKVRTEQPTVEFLKRQYTWLNWSTANL